MQEKNTMYSFANLQWKSFSYTSIARWLKYKYVQLFRVNEGASKVAAGFSIGLAVEMFTLPTLGLAFFLIFPLVFLLRASVAGALIGFVFGKLIYMPLAFLHNRVGGWIIPDHLQVNVNFLPNWFEEALLVNMQLIVGGIINGFVLGLLFFYPVKWLLGFYAQKRKTKRKIKLAQKNND